MQTEAARDWRVRRRLFFSELAGTALLVLGGLSVVIIMFGAGSPIAPLLPNEKVRTAVTAFLFGTIGSSIALSRIGKESGAHINPAVTLGFWLMRKLDARAASGYVIAQMLGGAAGAFPLLAWGSMGNSVAFGATIPGNVRDSLSLCCDGSAGSAHLRHQHESCPHFRSCADLWTVGRMVDLLGRTNSRYAGCDPGL